MPFYFIFRESLALYANSSYSSFVCLSNKTKNKSWGEKIIQLKLQSTKMCPEKEVYTIMKKYV